MSSLAAEKGRIQRCRLCPPHHGLSVESRVMGDYPARFGEHLYGGCAGS